MLMDMWKTRGMRFKTYLFANIHCSLSTSCKKWQPHIKLKTILLEAMLNADAIAKTFQQHHSTSDHNSAFQRYSDTYIHDTASIHTAWYGIDTCTLHFITLEFFIIDFHVTHYDYRNIHLSPRWFVRNV